MMARATFAFQGLTMRVEAPGPTIDWLREFVGPDFKELPGAIATQTVRLHEDDEAYDTLRLAGPHPANETVECFALDHHVSVLPRWASGDDTVLLFDGELRVFYRRGPDLALIELFSVSQNLSHRLAVLRVVRELAMAQGVHLGLPILHAAAVAWQHRGYVIAGPKKAGKTTLLLHLLSETGAQYVANDRVVVHAIEAGVSVSGLPTIVKVRRSSLDCLPTLRERFEATRYHHRRTVAEGDRLAASSWLRVAHDSFDLSPAQFIGLIGADRVGELPLAVVIFPRHSGRASGVAVNRLSPEATRERLHDSLFRAHASSSVGELFADELDRDQVRDRRLACADLAARVPGLECELGTDAYDAPFAASRLLDALEQSSKIDPR